MVRVPEPPWTRDLPRCNPPHDRLPRPANVVTHTALDETRALALGFRRRCSHCGCAMPSKVYRVFYSGPYGAHHEYPGELLVSASSGPMHRECALYSAVGCPFLKYPQSRQRLAPVDARFAAAKQAPRGPAAILGFRRYGVYYPALPCDYPQSWAWGYYQITERIPFTTWKDVVPLYERARDTAHIDVSSRLYWREESAAELAALQRYAQTDAARLNMMRASAMTLVEGTPHPLALL